MTFYEQQVRAIRDRVYPRQALSRQVIGAKEYMDCHFADRLDLDSISERAMISKYHFLRLFKGHYGMTPHQYLTEVRLREARRLLATDLPVAEVCAAVGFESVSSFKGLFKRYWAQTTSSCKKSNFRDGPSPKSSIV